MKFSEEWVSLKQCAVWVSIVLIIVMGIEIGQRVSSYFRGF